MKQSANPYKRKRHRFPAAIIQHAAWVYHRFNLSHRDIENLLAERGIDVSYARSHRPFTPPKRRARTSSIPRDSRALACEFVADAQRVLATQLGPPRIRYIP